MVTSRHHIAHASGSAALGCRGEKGPRHWQARGLEASAVEVLAETVNDNDPASRHCPAVLRDDIGKDGRLDPGVHPAFLHLPLATARAIGLARISLAGEVKSIYKGLCRGLRARDFSRATQERFVNLSPAFFVGH
jgi:hypothetical protein